MTERVLVFGNSHCACLKEAIDQQPKPVRDRFVFFASRAKRIRDIEIRGDKLVPTKSKLVEAFRVTSGGSEEISFERATCIVVVGLGLKVRPFPNVLYSSAVKAAAIKRTITGSTLFWLAQRISTVTNVPMLAFHDPFPAVSSNSDKTCESSVGYLELIDGINKYVSSRMKLQVVPQPKKTREGWFTKNGYSIGSKRLAVGAENDCEMHPESDFFHMNRAFGDAILFEIRERLG